MDVVNTPVATPRVAEPFSGAAKEPAPTTGVSKSFEDTLQSIYDAVTAAASGLIPVASVTDAAPAPAALVPPTNGSPAIAALVGADTAKLSSVSVGAPEVAPSPTEAPSSVESQKANAPVASSGVSQDQSAATIGNVQDKTPFVQEAPRVSGPKGRSVERSASTQSNPVATSSQAVAPVAVTSETDADDSKDSPDSTDAKDATVAVSAPDQSHVSGRSATRSAGGESLPGPTAVRNATVAEQRVNIASQGSLQLDAVRTMWSDVELSRARNNVEASVSTPLGDVQVAARVVKGETRIAVVASSALISAGGAGLEERVKKELQTAGIDVSDVKFSNADVSRERGRNSRNNNEREEQDAK